MKKYVQKWVVGLLFGSAMSACVTQGVDFENTFSLEEEEAFMNKVLLADPYIMVQDGMYYAYGTTNALGFHVFYSNDLVEWRRQEEPVLRREDSCGNTDFWAPEVYYDVDKDKYYMYYSSEFWMCMAVSDSPLGPFVQTEKRALWWGIDPTLFDDNGRKYVYYSDVQDVNSIKVNQVADFQDGRIESAATAFYTDCKWEGVKTVEGPTVVKVGKKYLMTYSGGEYYMPEYAVGVAVADDPMGPWEKYEGNPILCCPKYKGTYLGGTGHNSLFKDLDGNWRMVFHALSGKGIYGGRYMYIVSVDLLDHPPYIVFHDDLFAPVLAEEDATESSTGTK